MVLSITSAIVRSLCEGREEQDANTIINTLLKKNFIKILAFIIILNFGSSKGFSARFANRKTLGI